MKNYRRIGKFAPILFIASLSMFVCDMTRAEDSVKRKSGLWESKFTMMGMTHSAQECIDHDTDSFIKQLGNTPTTDCSVVNMQHHGKKISMHAVCKFNGYTVTTDGELSGDFNFAYSGKLTTSITKPADEVTLEETTIESKWLGSCPADRKAGTVIVTLPGTSESIEMDMNNPEVKAALEAMKAGIIRDQK